MLLGRIYKQYRKVPTQAMQMRENKLEDKKVCFLAGKCDPVINEVIERYEVSHLNSVKTKILGNFFYILFGQIFFQNKIFGQIFEGK